MILLLLLAADLSGNEVLARQGKSRDGGTTWAMECSNCSGSSSGPTYVADAGVLNINPISASVSALPLAYVADAGVLNVNPLSASVSSLPPTYVFDAGVLNVNALSASISSIPQIYIADAGPALNVNAHNVAVTAVPLTYVQDAGVLNVNPISASVSSIPLVYVQDAGTLNVNPLNATVTAIPLVYVADAGVLNVNPVNQGGTWTDRVVGNAGAAFDSANNASPPANVLAVGYETVASGSQPTAATGGNERRPMAGIDGVAFNRPGGPVTWSCTVELNGGTLTQCQAAPAAGLSLYLTDVNVWGWTDGGATVGNGVAGVRFGTGTNCATGTGNVIPSSSANPRINYQTNGAGYADVDMITAIKITAANALCVTCTSNQPCTVQIEGYTAP